MVNPRGKWAFPKRKRGKPRKAHLMSNETMSFCGRMICTGEVMDDDWNPEEHAGVVCERCLREWWIPVLKRHIQPHKATCDRIQAA